MGNDIATKQNCAQPFSPRLTFDGMTDDSFCFAYTVASTTYSFDKGPDLECLDYYVQGGDGESVVNTSDICPRGNRLSKQNQQAAVIQTLNNAGFQHWTKWMYALSEALTPMTLQSSILKTNDNSRRKEMKELDDRITEARKVLCWHNGYERDKAGLSPLIIDALEDCLSPEEVEKNRQKRESESKEFKKSGDARPGTPDISAWGPSFWKSIFSL
nr:hypothetical protein [bacterium]